MTFDKNLTRRKFVKSAGILAACGLNLSFIQVPNQKNKLGIALVGLGGYSNGQLGPALLETKHCYLAGIVTGTPAKEKQWASRYNIPEKNIYNYENFDSIAQNPDIDIVYVVLPIFMHKEFTIRAAQAGKKSLGTCSK